MCEVGRARAILGRPTRGMLHTIDSCGTLLATQHDHEFGVLTDLSIPKVQRSTVKFDFEEWRAVSVMRALRLVSDACGSRR